MMMSSFAKAYGLDPATVSALLANREQGILAGTAPLGRATELKCSCGGVLHEYDPSNDLMEHATKAAGKPRYSKRKRQMKKNLKRWKATHSFKMLMATIIARPIMRNPPSFKCASCARRVGFYETMARNMFKIDSWS